MTVHSIEGNLEPDEQGFYSARCTCGWEPVSIRDEKIRFPDKDIVVDVLMGHAYLKGLEQQGPVTVQQKRSPC